jgi:hypothetical protein
MYAPHLLVYAPFIPDGKRVFSIEPVPKLKKE